MKQRRTLARRRSVHEARSEEMLLTLIPSVCCWRWSVGGNGECARYTANAAEEVFSRGQPVTQQTFQAVIPLLHDAVYESIKSRPLEVGYKKESVKGVFALVFEELLRQFAEKESMYNVADYSHMYGE